MVFTNVYINRHSVQLSEQYWECWTLFVIEMKKWVLRENSDDTRVILRSAPLKTSDFLWQTFHGCSTQQGRTPLLTKSFHIFYCLQSVKVNRTMTSGFQGARYFRRYDRELVSKPAISLKKSWGSYYRRTSLSTHDLSRKSPRKSAKASLSVGLGKKKRTDSLQSTHPRKNERVSSTNVSWQLNTRKDMQCEKNVFMNQAVRISIYILLAIHAVAPSHIRPPPPPPPLFYFLFFFLSLSCSNALPNHEIRQSNKHFHALDVASLSF